MVVQQVVDIKTKNRINNRLRFTRKTPLLTLVNLLDPNFPKTATRLPLDKPTKCSASDARIALVVDLETKIFFCFIICFMTSGC